MNVDKKLSLKIKVVQAPNFGLMKIAEVNIKEYVQKEDKKFPSGFIYKHAGATYQLIELLINVVKPNGLLTIKEKIWSKQLLTKDDKPTIYASLLSASGLEKMPWEVDEVDVSVFEEQPIEDVDTSIFEDGEVEVQEEIELTPLQKSEEVNRKQINSIYQKLLTIKEMNKVYKADFNVGHYGVSLTGENITVYSK